MSVIKQISVFNGDDWEVNDIGADADNISLSSTVTLTDILPVSKLTINKALASNGNGIISASSVTSTLLEYLSGASSNIQIQIDNLNTDLNTKTSGSGTASNSYGSCSYTWVRYGKIVNVYILYTPSTNINNSSGALTLSTIPTPSLSNIYGETFDYSSAGTNAGSVEITNDKNCYFNGPRTSGHKYKSSVTYAVN